MKPETSGLDPAQRLRVLGFLALCVVVVGICVLVLNTVAPRLEREAGQYLVFSSISVAMLLLTLVSTLLYFGTFADKRARLARSRSTMATVSGIATSGTGSSPIETPTVRYEADGRWHETATALPKSKLQVGQSLPVRYDAEDPDWVVVDGRDPIHWRLVLWMQGGFVLTLLACVAVPLLIAPHPWFR